MRQPARVASRWLQAVLFDAPPKMLAQAQDIVRDYWCQGLLWHVNENRTAAARARNFAVTSPLRKLRKTLAALPQLVAQAPEGKWSQFRFIPEQNTPDVFDNLGSFRPNPGAITRTPWRQQSHWLWPLTPEEIAEHEQSWDKPDGKPRFWLVRDERHRARPPSKPGTYIQDTEQVLDTLKYAYTEGIESIEYSTGWFNDLTTNLDSLEAFARKYASASRKPEGSLDFNLAVDLAGWKYFPADMIEIAERRMPRSITLRFTYGSNDKYLGLWYGPPTWRLEVLARDYALSSVSSMQAFLKDITRTTRHEMQHFGQDALGSIKNLKEDGGLPTRNVRTRGNLPLPMEEGDPYGRIKHELRDVEFHTRLADEVDRFLDALKDPEETGSGPGVPVEHWAAFIKQFTGAETTKAPRSTRYRVEWPQSPWFMYIKKHDKKRWKEAVRKLIAELNQRGIMRQIKRVKRWVPVVESSHPAWGVSVLGYLRERMGKLSPGTGGWGIDKDEKDNASRKHWPTIRDEYESFTDSLSPDQLVRHKQLVNENGDKWYFINPKLKAWDGAIDLGGSKPPHADHPDLPKMHQYKSAETQKLRRSSPSRVAARWLQAARPIPLDKGYLRTLAKQTVQDTFKAIETEVRRGRPAWKYKALKSYRRGNGLHLEVSVPLRIHQVVKRGLGIVPPNAEINIPLWVSTTKAKTHRNKLVAGGRWLQIPDLKHHEVSIQLYESRHAADLEAGPFEAEVFDTLIHEATHIVDLYTREAESSEGLDDSYNLADEEAYANDPREVRAFMQQIADQIIRDLQSGSPSVAYSISTNDLWTSLKTRLNDRNRKLILKGVYTAIQDADLPQQTGWGKFKGLGEIDHELEAWLNR